MSDDDSGVIVQFPGSLLERDFPLSRRKVPQDGGRCRHDKTVIDPEAHTLACRACDQPLDPWEVLARWSREYDYIHGRFVAAKSQAEAAERRLGNLKVVEKNAKARIQKAERSTPTGDLILSLVRERHDLYSDTTIPAGARYEAMEHIARSLQRALDRDLAERSVAHAGRGSA